jgi:GH24 family phage-related lysozyme (muramidase)/murein DD-endopeptidase MepM/ murein hydrolase activator NlpD
MKKESKPARSEITVALIDILGAPIKDLKYEIKSKEKLLAQGSTDSNGETVVIVGRIGDPLEFYVKKLLSDEMKLVAQTTFTIPSELLVLQSPKLMLEMGLVIHEGDKGVYKRKTHQVKKGETPEKIAKNYGCDKNELMRINQLAADSKLSAGKVIKIPPKASDTPAPVKQPDPVKSNTPTVDWFDTVRNEGQAILDKLSSAHIERGENGLPKLVFGNICSDKNHCLQIGSPDSDLIMELNIRLAGFGGAVPSKKFTKLTEFCVKQFQRDYMGAAETGKVCGGFLKSLDKFKDEYPIDRFFNGSPQKDGGLECPCSLYGGKVACNGWGVQNAPNEYNGIHRSLMWALRAAMFYMATKEKDLGYSIKNIDSGYRCNENNHGHNGSHSSRTTINHMGHAVDLHILKDGKYTRSVADMNSVRKNIFEKYIRAGYHGDGSKNRFHLEPERYASGKSGATSWVHLDVTSFEPKKFQGTSIFVTNNSDVNLGNMIELARSLGFSALALCSGSGSLNAVKPMNTGDRVPIEKLTLSAKGKAFVQDWEKLAKLREDGKVYPYPDKYGYCTIGWGHLVDGKKSISELESSGSEKYNEVKSGISVEKAREIFDKVDLPRIETITGRAVKVPLYQYEYDALVSLIFNIGGFEKCPNLLKKLNDSDYEGACEEFADINKETKDGKKVEVASLTKRRNSEMQIFLKNVYDSSH